MQLTTSQEQAIAKIMAGVQQRKGILALSGAAGTGKTTIISSLVDQFVDAEVCTPTNKAAQVLCNKGIEATTFYRKFYMLEKVEGRKPFFIACDKYPGRLPVDKREFVDVMIIDEASMVSSKMVAEMKRMCNTLILVGDRHQLPPVGDRDTPAGYFASLTPDAELTEVLRQEEGSLILSLANEVRQAGPRVGNMLRQFEPQEHFIPWAKRGGRAIAFTNKERQRINRVVRNILGFDRPTPMPGDRVIGTSNYSEDFLNGTEATVTSFDWVPGSPLADIGLQLDEFNTIHTVMMMAPFIEDQIPSQQALLTAEGSPDVIEHEAVELTFGYCLTAHKAQGSEWPEVAVFDQLGLIRKIQAGNTRTGMSPEEYARRWLYTAVTRARQKLVFAPTWWAQSYQMEDVA